MYNNQLLKIEKSYTLKEYTKTMSVKEFYESYVNFNETLKSCKYCDTYNKNWSCPPFDKDMTYIWNSYENMDMYLLELHYNENIQENIYKQEDIDVILNLTLFNEKRKLLNRLYDEVKEKEGMILSTGYCNICSKCSKITHNPCRYPKNKLHSIESVGGLVTKASKELFGTEILWINMEKGKIPEHLSLLMALLY